MSAESFWMFTLYLETRISLTPARGDTPGASGTATGGVLSAMNGSEQTAVRSPSAVMVSTTHLYRTPCAKTIDRGAEIVNGPVCPMVV